MTSSTSTTDLNIAQKCTWCAHLLDKDWKEPRCVDACPTGALTFGEEADLKDLIAKAEVLKPETKAQAPHLLHRPTQQVLHRRRGLRPRGRRVPGGRHRDPHRVCRRQEDRHAHHRRLRRLLVRAPRAGHLLATHGEERATPPRPSTPWTPPRTSTWETSSCTRGSRGRHRSRSPTGVLLAPPRSWQRSRPASARLCWAPRTA